MKRSYELTSKSGTANIIFEQEEEDDTSLVYVKCMGAEFYINLSELIVVVAELEDVRDIIVSNKTSEKE